MKYLQRLDDDRLQIKEMDGEDANKIRGKIIIGRDGDAKQREALRRFNGHQHRIEVITFDQLVRIGEPVLRDLRQVVDPLSHEGWFRAAGQSVIIDWGSSTELPHGRRTGVAGVTAGRSAVEEAFRP